MSKNTAAPRAEPPRTRRPAASGKTSQGRKSRSIRPSTRSPTSSRPRRASPGENFAARQTAHQLSHRIRAGLVRGELRASADGPCTNRPTAPTQGHFRENSSGSSGQSARQLNLTAGAETGRCGENFAGTKVALRQTVHSQPCPIAPTQGYAGGELRASADGPCTNRPHRAHAGPFQGKLLRLIRTARPSAQPHRTRAELLRRKLRRDESYCPTDGTTACRANRPRCIRAELRRGKLRGPADCPCTDRSHRARAGSFQGKFHRHVRLPARQPNPISPAQGCSGENFTGTKVALRQTRQQSVRQPPPPHPRRAISGEISQACQTARPSVQPNLTRTGLFREKLHKPKNHSAADGLKATPHQTAQRSPPVQPFWSNFAARQDSPPVSSTSPHPRRAAPGKTSQAKNHSASDGATLADPSKHSGQTSRPGRRRNDHSSARPPRPNFLRTKAPARRSPGQIGTPLTPRPATAQRCPARRWRP